MPLWLPWAQGLRWTRKGKVLTVASVNHTTPRKRVARITYQAGGWRWQDDIEPAGAPSYSPAYRRPGEILDILRARVNLPEPFTHYRLANRPLRGIHQ